SQSRSSKNKKMEIDFSWPIKRSEFWISSLFGSRKKPNGIWGFHYGIDMAAMRGTPVKAACPGIIVEARFSSGYGNTIVIAHGRKYRTRYAHLNKILVRVGQKVKQQQLIGKVGRTGLVWKSQGRDPSHLHFEVHAFGKKVNPMKILP
ncbi:M23 family metallopeptidase, partial [bacterium]|nr:M23 family metallopeptidase [bacterium]